MPYLLAGAAALPLAVLVYGTRPDRAQNRWLGALLWADGLAYGAGGLFYSMDDPSVAVPLQMAFNVVFFPAAAAYLMLASTLASPLARPLRSRVTLPVMAIAVAAFLVVMLARQDRFIEGVHEPFYAAFEITSGPWMDLTGHIYAGLVLYAFAVALTAFLTAPGGTPSRARARMFAIAFGSRDAILLFALLAAPLAYDPAAARMVATLVVVGFPVSSLVLSTLLSYGILKHQMFDIDLKIKWTLQRGTVAAAFLAAFFVVSELAAGLLSERVGLVAGVVAAGLLVFMLVPLQRLAERVADRAMPRVQDTAEYRLVRKREVYRAALEGAVQDGVVTEKERDILARLQDQLGLSATEARSIERELKGAAG